MGEKGTQLNVYAKPMSGEIMITVLLISDPKRRTRPAR